VGLPSSCAAPTCRALAQRLHRGFSFSAEPLAEPDQNQARCFAIQTNSDGSAPPRIGRPSAAPHRLGSCAHADPAAAACRVTWRSNRDRPRDGDVTGAARAVMTRISGGTAGRSEHDISGRLASQFIGSTDSARTVRIVHGEAIDSDLARSPDGDHPPARPASLGRLPGALHVGAPKAMSWRARLRGGAGRWRTVLDRWRTGTSGPGTSPEPASSMFGHGWTARGHQLGIQHLSQGAAPARDSEARACTESRMFELVKLDTRNCSLYYCLATLEPEWLIVSLSMKQADKYCAP
jgi:hypothetical protein